MAEVVARACDDLANALAEADSPEDYAQLQQVLLEDPLWTACLERQCLSVIEGIRAG